MTITLTWWMIPTIITVIGVWWALFWVERHDRSIFSGLGKILALVPVLFVSCIAWIIAGVLK